MCPANPIPQTTTMCPAVHAHPTTAQPGTESTQSTACMLLGSPEHCAGLPASALCVGHACTQAAARVGLNARPRHPASAQLMPKRTAYPDPMPTRHAGADAWQAGLDLPPVLATGLYTSPAQGMCSRIFPDGHLMPAAAARQPTISTTFPDCCHRQRARTTPPYHTIQVGVLRHTHPTDHP
jgi:hypothetical protein